MLLEKCPDKNAKLVFRLSAHIEEEIALDAISNSSGKTVNVETLVDAGPITNSVIQQGKSVVQASKMDGNVNVPTKDVPPSSGQSKIKRYSTVTSI